MDLVLAGTIVIVVLAVLFGVGWIGKVITNNKKNVPKV